MKKTLIALALAAFAFAPVACNTSSSGGVPGTKNSFTLKGPTMTTDVKQGEKKQVEITIDRKEDFKQDVTFEATAPTGIKVDFLNKTVKASDPAKATMTIEADKTAAVGDHTVTVKAKPETGNATTVDVKVKVEEAKK